MRLADAAISWLRSKAPALKSSTRQRYASTLDIHILPVLGDHYVHAITPDDVVAWRDGQGDSPVSVNDRLRILKQLLADRRVLEQVETDTPQWFPIALTLALTGARWGEVSALRWSDIDETRGMIVIERAHVRAVVDTTKTDIKKALPLVPSSLGCWRRIAAISSLAKRPASPKAGCSRRRWER